MSKTFFTNAVEWAHLLCRRTLRFGDHALDGTMGNGYDTALLSELVGQNGLVYAFDVQEVALKTTKKRLQAAGLLAQTRLILDSHQRLAHYVQEPLRLAIFNLGYLPGGDHGVTTEAPVVLTAAEQCLELLQPGGLLILVVYPGHPRGKEELAALEQFTATLKQKRYTAARLIFCNQVNEPPQLFCIERRV